LRIQPANSESSGPKLFFSFVIHTAPFTIKHWQVVKVTRDEKSMFAILDNHSLLSIIGEQPTIQSLVTQLTQASFFSEPISRLSAMFWEKRGQYPFIRKV
jgi:hypothetical protein